MTGDKIKCWSNLIVQITINGAYILWNFKSSDLNLNWPLSFGCLYETGSKNFWVRVQTEFFSSPFLPNRYTFKVTIVYTHVCLAINGFNNFYLNNNVK